MEAKKIVYSKPSITGLEINYASDAAKMMGEMIVTNI